MESGGKLYVVGGFANDIRGFEEPLDTMWIYDTQSGEISRGQSMPTGTALAASCKGPDGRLYVFGGYNHSIGGYTYFTQIYDPETDSWSNGSNSPEPIGDGTAIALPDGRIVILGGAVYNQNRTLVFDPLADRWSYLTDQPAMIWLRRAVLWNNTAIIVMGGREYTTSLETADVAVLNPVTEKWTARSAMISAAFFGGAAIGANGYVYYVGGSTGMWPDLGSVSGKIQRYDFETDAWELSDSVLPTGLAGFGCVADAHGRIFLVGGYDGSSTVSSIVMMVPADIDWDSIAITSPNDGSVVSGEVTVTVEALNLWYGFATVELYVDGALLEAAYVGWDESVSFVWDTQGLPEGSTHVLMARGFVYSGEIVEDSVEVTVWSRSPAEHIVTLEENMTALQEGLLMMLVGQAAAMDDLNATLVDLQEQLDDFKEQIDRVEGKADDANMWGMVNMGLVIVILVLAAILVVTVLRKK